MNSLTIPPSPNWYENTVFACASDNTVIYGSRSDLVVIKPKDLSEPADIKIIPRAHHDKIISVAVSPVWEKKKLAVTLAADKSVKLWNIEDYTLLLSHRGHTASSSDVVGVTFAGSDRIVSVSTDGAIIVWRFGPNELVHLKDLLGIKPKVTCLSACPHCNWLVAFGMHSGLIIVTDLRRSGRVLYKLRRHDEAILSFSWCPVQYNVLHKPDSSEHLEEELKNLDLNPKTPSKNANLWTNLKHADDEETVESSQSRPVPQHFDLEDDCFGGEAAIADLSEELTPNRQRILKARRNKAQTADCEENLEEAKPDEKTDDDFLAACAALRKQILDKKPTDTDVTEEELNTVIETKDNCDVESKETTKVSSDDTLGNVDETQRKIKTCPVEQLNSDELATTLIKLDKEYLLASSSKAGNIICVWSVGGSGRLQAELHLPGRPHKYKGRGTGNIWITLLWIAPTILLSSSKQGELLSWDLKKLIGKGHDLKPTLIHNDHASILFCIVAPVELNKEQAEGNWRKDKSLSVWTVGQDRSILNTSLGSSREVCISYPTIGGPVQCLAQSSLDPNRVAIGISDGTVRVWDLSKPHLQCIIMSRLWQRMNSKILSLAWHPTKEAILAYGTFEGRIGIADTLHPAKLPTLMTQYFNKGIYQLQWGPLKGETNLGLYACSEGKIVVYNSDKPIEDPFVILTPDSEQITQFTWNDDYSIFVLGAKSGTIFFYTSDFQLLHTAYHQQKAVQCLLWHPEAFIETTTYSGWLASATNDVSFAVYDCRCLFNSDGGGDKEVTVVANLTGHSGSIRSLSWNPHDGSKLVTVGEDSLAQVWDISTKTVIASYLGHGTDGILAVLWSPLDSDFVITGGRDNTVRIWKVSDWQPIEPSALESATKTKKKSGRSENVITEEQHDAPKTKKVLDSLSKLDHGPVTEQIDDCRRLFLTQQKNSEETATNGKLYKIDVLDIFRTRDDVLKLLEAEEEKHLKSGKRQQAHHISLWKGDISETIKHAIANGTVTPFLISLAPMVSPKLWQEACEVYSKKLTESSKGDPLETAAYFLACHKVEEAIEALLAGGLFREALALAKSRLGEENPLVTTILERWATASMFDGNFEIAAQCYIALGKLEDAVKLLFRRSDETTLKLALDMAEHVNNEDLRKAVLVRYNAFKNETKETGGDENGIASSETFYNRHCN